MHILLNGKEHQLNGPASIESLLKGLGQGGSRVVVELNSTIIRREQYQSASLNDGDKVEIVRLVGGG